MKSRDNKSKRRDIVDLSQRARVNVTHTELFAHGQQDPTCGTFHRWSAQCDGRQIPRGKHTKKQNFKCCAPNARLFQRSLPTKPMATVLSKLIPLPFKDCFSLCTFTSTWRTCWLTLPSIWARSEKTEEHFALHIGFPVLTQENLLSRTHTRTRRKHDPRKCTFFGKKKKMSLRLPQNETPHFVYAWCAASGVRSWVLVWVFWCVRSAPVRQEELPRARGVAHLSGAKRTGGERIAAAIQRATHTTADCLG